MNSGGRCRVWAAALLAAMASACTDAGPSAPDAAEVDAAVAEKPVLAAYTCGVSLARETVTCAPPSPGSSGARMARIFGTQGVEVVLRSFNSVYDDSTEVLSADVTIKSLVNEWLGTPDSATVTGVRVFFHEGPTVLAGEGAVEVLGDGFDTFTGAQQPYYDYAQIIKPLETSAVREWRFQVSPTVQEFSFTVLLVAETTALPGVPLTPAPIARVVVDGVASADSGAVVPAANVVVENGLLRLTLARYLGGQDRTSHVIAGFADGQWTELNSRKWGDWTFIGDSGLTDHTDVEILANTDTLVGVRWTFGNHVVRARYGYAAYPYAFTKTVWLRALERGYYVQVVVLDTVPTLASYNEYEVGWGGITAAGRITTSTQSVRTDSATSNVRFNLSRATEAAQFDVFSSSWRRALVPLPGDEMILGVFSGNSHGIWIYGNSRRTSYGAYVYAAPLAEAKPTRTVCREAIERSPFALPPMDATNCGPAS